MGLSHSTINSKARSSSNFSFNEIITRKNISEINSVIPKHISSIQIELRSKNLFHFKRRNSVLNDSSGDISNYIYLKCDDGWHLSMEFIFCQKKKTPCIRMKISKEYINVVSISFEERVLAKKEAICEIRDLLIFGVDQFLKEIENFGLMEKDSQHFASFIYFNMFK